MSTETRTSSRLSARGQESKISEAAKVFYHSLYKYGRKEYNTEAVKGHDEYSDNDDCCDDDLISCSAGGYSKGDLTPAPTIGKRLTLSALNISK